MNIDIIKFIAMERYNNININNLFIPQLIAQTNNWAQKLITFSKSNQNLLDYANVVGAKYTPDNYLPDLLSLVNNQLNYDTCNAGVLLAYLIVRGEKITANLKCELNFKLDMRVIQYVVDKLIPFTTHRTQIYALSGCINDNNLYIKLIEQFFNLPVPTTEIQELFQSNADKNMITKLFIANGIFRPTNMQVINAMIEHYNYDKKLYTLFCIENHEYISNDGYNLVYLDGDVVEKFILSPIEHYEKSSLYSYFKVALYDVKEQQKYLNQMRVYLELTR